MCFFDTAWFFSKYILLIGYKKQQLYNHLSPNDRIGLNGSFYPFVRKNYFPFS